MFFVCLAFVCFFFNQTSELISVFAIDLSHCTFDFPCKKEDKCGSCYSHKQMFDALPRRCVAVSIPVSSFPHIFKVFIANYRKDKMLDLVFFSSWTLYSNINNTLAT